MNEDIGFAITWIAAIVMAIMAWRHGTPQEMARSPFMYRAAYTLLMVRGVLFVAKDLLHLF